MKPGAGPRVTVSSFLSVKHLSFPLNRVCQQSGNIKPKQKKLGLLAGRVTPPAHTHTHTCQASTCKHTAGSAAAALSMAFCEGALLEHFAGKILHR